MGLLVDGIWRTDWYDTAQSGGRFERSAAKFRNFVTADGSPGPTGRGGFRAASGRYHLYVSHACPWAHRTVILRHLKGLEPHVGLSVVHPLMLEDGWSFAADFEGATGDTLAGHALLREVYLAADPQFSGRVTVPVLWDRETGTIVSNESAEIVRMFNTAFDGITGNTLDLYPEALRAEIDALNARIYGAVNNGVYRAGFATTQAAYDEAVAALFDGLDWLEGLLRERRYLTGGRLTEADWRLWTTLIRFDAVYHGHFKCNLRMLKDYPALWGFTRELWQMPGIAARTRLDHIRHHYHRSHETINPHRILPAGPRIDYDAPHGRG